MLPDRAWASTELLPVNASMGSGVVSEAEELLSATRIESKRLASMVKHLSEKRHGAEGAWCLASAREEQARSGEARTARYGGLRCRSCIATMHS